MRETYRKRGRSVRWENGTIVRVNESGVAMESEDKFTCHPDPGLASVNATTDPRDDGRVESVARSIVVPAGVRIERLLVMEGEAEHTFRDVSWHDATRRVHLALARNHLRVLIDLGDFDVGGIAPIADALARCEESEREAPPRLRLAPHVTAALLPSLPDVAQRAGGIDGKGNAIEDARAPWPNWYRPSYRVRPVRMPFNLTPTCAVAELDDSLPLAIALVGVSHMLIVDGDRAYPSAVRIARLDAISEPRRWFPYGAGAWGAHAVARPA
jgi:hypothetical protein